jgi:hypothetical protein
LRAAKEGSILALSSSGTVLKIGACGKLASLAGGTLKRLADDRNDFEAAQSNGRVVAGSSLFNSGRTP